MAKPLSAVEAVERMTDGLCGLLRKAFPGQTVGLTFGPLSALLERADAAGGLWVNLLDWSHLETPRSRIGGRLRLQYIVVIAQRVAGMDWPAVWPAAKAWFEVHDLLRKRRPDCPGLIRREVVGDRYGDRGAIAGDGGVFWGDILVSYEVKVR